MDRQSKGSVSWLLYSLFFKLHNWTFPVRYWIFKEILDAGIYLAKSGQQAEDIAYSFNSLQQGDALYAARLTHLA